jgi:hypothetical protein
MRLFYGEKLLDQFFGELTPVVVSNIAKRLLASV